MNTIFVIACSASFLFTYGNCDDMSNAPLDVRVYFSELDNDMTKVTWAHRCNSEKELKSALADDHIMMIEADIIEGHLIGDPGGTPIPVMGHPPDTQGDISLEQFLDRVLKERKRKGIKLDFKSTTIFKASENVLEQFLAKAEVDFPVWINADILRGPGVPATKEVVEANHFLSTCVKKFPTALISPGWAVDVKSAKSLQYDSSYIDGLTSLLEENNVVHPVTFPVHAGIASNSVEALTKLIHTSVDGTSLTLWAGEGEYINYLKLQELISHIGKDKIFIDLPKQMRDQLNAPPESKGSGVMVRACLGSAAFITMGLFCLLCVFTGL